MRRVWLMALCAALFAVGAAALVVVGRFDPARLDAWVDRHFGAIPRPALAAAETSVTFRPTAPAPGGDITLSCAT